MRRCDACFAEVDRLKELVPPLLGLEGVRDVCEKCETSLNDVVRYADEAVNKIRKRARINVVARALRGLRKVSR